MNTYLTWIVPEEDDKKPAALPASTEDLVAVSAFRPGQAAEIRAKGTSRNKHPWCVRIGVVKADQIGKYGAHYYKYIIYFDRLISSVEKE